MSDEQERDFPRRICAKEKRARGSSFSIVNVREQKLKFIIKLNYNRISNALKGLKTTNYNNYNRIMK